MPMKAKPGVTPGGRHFAISRREEEVLQCVADGFSTQEIAAGLYISVPTVKNHLGRIYRKLNARDRTHALSIAIRTGIVQLEVEEIAS